jgi:hypothetical protein
MTGTGTQQDPYIVNNFPDFLTAAAVSGAYVEFDGAATNKVIDINDTAYAAGLTDTITLNCAHIAGNGWAIRNLYINWADINLFTVPDGKTVTVEDLKCPNIVMNTPSAKWVVRAIGSAEFKNCHFSGLYTCSPSATSYAGLITGASAATCVLRRCTVNIKLDDKCKRTTFWSVMFDTCNIMLDMDGRSWEGSTGTNTIFRNCVITNCVLRGEFSNLGGALSELILFENDCVIRSSYAAIAMRGDANRHCSLSGSFDSVCFFDKNILTNGIYYNKSSSEANVKLLTTAQCKDAEYLASIGFPCVADSGVS